MTDKEKPAAKPPQSLSDAETAKVVGGMLAREPESCKETGDSGTTGCPG